MNVQLSFTQFLDTPSYIPISLYTYIPYALYPNTPYISYPLYTLYPYALYIPCIRIFLISLSLVCPVSAYPLYPYPLYTLYPLNSL
ncbi:hypothetical protein CK934_07185 [Chitinophaga sp. MD30]|nr:hypothetical protein CK934_07185 [Chitinophaga sp. MD30]